jgi:hypothetical protein
MWGECGGDGVVEEEFGGWEVTIGGAVEGRDDKIECDWYGPIWFERLEPARSICQTQAQVHTRKAYDRPFLRL